MTTSKAERLLRLKKKKNTVFLKLKHYQFFSITQKKKVQGTLASTNFLKLQQVILNRSLSFLHFAEYWDI